MKRTDPDGKTMNGRRAALSLVAGAAILAGIYGCSDGSGNAPAPAPDTSISEIKPLLKGDIAAMALREERDDLSALAFNGPDGRAMTLADTGGKVRLVNIWATWCAPCRAEMPSLDELQRTKGGDAFEVVAISVDNGSDEKPRAFYDEIGIKDMTFYHDPTLNVFNTLKKQGLAFGLPVTMLVDENNRVIANMNGPAHWSGADAQALVDALVAEKSSDPAQF